MRETILECVKKDEANQTYLGIKMRFDWNSRETILNNAVRVLILERGSVRGKNYWTSNRNENMKLRMW